MNNQNNNRALKRLLITTFVVGTFQVNAKVDLHEAGKRKLESINKTQVVTEESFTQSSVLKSRVDRSEFIFRGKLSEINERLSIENIPYTFVTYFVTEVIAGKYTDNTITVKFVGGTFPNGNRLTASNSPRVNVGEDAILMIQQSLDTGCDFVDCEGGRFVIENGKVIAANESAILVGDKSGVQFVPLSTHNKKQKQLLSQKSNVPRFIEHLKSLKNNNKSAKNLDKPMSNTDINKPFNAYSGLTRPEKAPALVDEKLGVKLENSPLKLEGSRFDQWEVEQLKKNGGDPLLRASTSEDNH